jgi:hypothetical protein
MLPQLATCLLALRWWRWFAPLVIHAKLGSALSASRIVLPICDGVTLVTFRTPIAHRELPVLEGFHVGN